MGIVVKTCKLYSYHSQFGHKSDKLWSICPAFSSFLSNLCLNRTWFVHEFFRLWWFLDDQDRILPRIDVSQLWCYCLLFVLHADQPHSGIILVPYCHILQFGAFRGSMVIMKWGYSITVKVLPPCHREVCVFHTCCHLSLWVYMTPGDIMPFSRGFLAHLLRSMHSWNISCMGVTLKWGRTIVSSLFHWHNNIQGALAQLLSSPLWEHPKERFKNKSLLPLSPLV